MYRPPHIPKLEELDWRARKRPVVPDASKAARQPYLICRPGSKRGRYESSRSYQKEVGKLKNGETKAKYVPNQDGTIPVPRELSEGEKEG